MSRVTVGLGVTKNFECKEPSVLNDRHAMSGCASLVMVKSPYE